MKLRQNVWERPLRAAYYLAVISMVLTVALAAGALTWWTTLPLGSAVLLAAALAPTDPVLASEVQLRHARDHDRIRVTLSVEGGLNDGTAFPLVLLGLGLLGLHDLGDTGWRWFTVDVLWAGVAGIGIGALLGYAAGTLIVSLQRKRPGALALGEYLVIGLIGVSYGAAILVHAYGFLAVFATGVALRSVERKATSQTRLGDAILNEEGAVTKLPQGDPRATPAYLAGSLLSFNEQLEHILEVALVLVVGAILGSIGVNATAIWFSVLLFCVLRPLACAPVVFLERFTAFEGGAVAWFGIRGIGSLYYVMYAVEHGLVHDLARPIVSFVITVIACSIVAHGISVTPLLDVYRKRRGRTKKAPQPSAT
jgi:NhaP-type Na+/H+ or K+/H+ antiporter